ncbi:MAG: hypothetical protein KC502_04070 [Myxococcales bacterium]|nr:hypothetical protein [Myxococcales bacterium]
MRTTLTPLFTALLIVAVAAGCSESKTNSAGGGQGASDVTAGQGDSTQGDPDSTGATGDAQASGDGTTGGDGSIAAQECLAPGKGDCDDNSECGSDFYCDPCTRKCLTPRKACEPCSVSSQCANAELGSACLPFLSGGTHCGAACLGDAGCPQGYACKTIKGVTAKQCVPKSGDCAPAAGQCKKDSDCPYTTICNAEYGQCLKGCTNDKNCPGGKVCSLFRCVAPCADDAACVKLSAEAKCVDKHCKIPGGCLAANECPEKETYCDLNDHKCKPGCLTDFDCKEFGKKCEASKCIEKGCKENWECGFGQVCKPATGKCEKAKGPYCGKCDAQDDKATACGGAPHKCLSFQDENKKKVGDFCLLACGSDPAGPCPQGYQCQDLKDQDGKSQGKVCVRQCWIDPFEETKP